MITPSIDLSPPMRAHAVDAGGPAKGWCPSDRGAYFAFFGARWLRADPAAVFDVLLVRPSRSTFEAADAALALVFRGFVICPSPP